MDRIVEPISKNIPDGILPKEIAIKIDSTGRETQCQLWVGVYKSGPLKPVDLFNSAGLEEKLKQAGEVGIQEHDHVMLTGSESQPQHILLFSKDFFESDRKAMIDNLCSQIEALKIKSVGFYLNPNLFGVERALELTADTLRFLCLKQTFEAIYLLKGDFDYNRLLNLSLQLKSGLDNRSLLLSLYH